MAEEQKDHDSVVSSFITQIVIFHPDAYRVNKAARELDRAADRQRGINLELERIQVDDNGVVRSIVLGTNNFVYAVIDYPADELNMKEGQP
jgi:hypothetical protein